MSKNLLFTVSLLLSFSTFASASESSTQNVKADSVQTSELDNRTRSRSRL